MEAWIIAFVCSTLLALAAVLGRALTRAAVCLAWCFALIICRFGGLPCFAVLAAVFALTVLAGKASSKIRAALDRDIHEKSGRRDSVQIICNVGTGAALIALFALTDRNTFECAYAAVMAASLADSLASEIGVLSKAQPVDILTFKRVPAGISGGVSPLGLACSLLGSAAIAALYCALSGAGAAVAAKICLLGFLGALADSVLGSAVQAKYRCSVCSIITEKREHCGAATVRVRGAAFINNDAVNLLNNLFTAALAVLII